ncbi:39S ribosomal protein L13, mitochondrial isoform X1 [Leopardus geoffroyi]|uniref:39S ribosomal protein L13, mitochondrial isoform X1 n=1 Tax=Leopardus geoffroyi TaxID=46844 RepID=UPI001E264168|nr:39S ribosomal protein L13, mitochondrial isoform X1 [Leopardus geoffroyi]
MPRESTFENRDSGRRLLLFSLQWATFARVWYLLDGKMQPPGKLAALASIKLQGLHKPVYHQLSDCGDHVVIMNTRHIAFSGNKWEQKVYSSHTGYPGGFRQVTAAQLHQKDPVAIVKLAIYGMLPKNLHRRTLMQRLHLFPDEDIPEDIRENLVEELPQPRKVPRRLDEYTREEIEAFPRVWSPFPYLAFQAVRDLAPLCL